MDLEFLKTINDYVNETNHLYQVNYVDGLITKPIPFFGDIESAEILTVGVNPASSEFDNRRKWPDKMSIEELEFRLRNYFALDFPKPHRWFEKWEKALNILDHSFKCNAAHIDLSPRATIAMRNAPNQSAFIDMIHTDMRLFFQLLTYCKHAKLLVIAGIVTKGLYMNEFIRHHSQKYGFHLDGDFKRPSGNAKIAYYSLIGNNIKLPVFFCSVSPSAFGSDSDWLVKRVEENKIRLMSYLCPA